MAELGVQDGIAWWYGRRERSSVYSLDVRHPW